MAGEVIAVGAGVKHWKKGDRVCSNFCTDHLDGDTNEEIIKTSLGGQSPGVLTQYKNLPAHVRTFLITQESAVLIFQKALVSVPQHLTYEQASTLPLVSLICQFGKRNSHRIAYSCAALTAYAALYGPCPVKSGDTVLIQGTGGVSMRV